MARGFESKDVEYQQSEAQRPKVKAAALTPEQRAVAERRRTLELALTRARADFAAAKADPHRAMLQQAIAALEAELGRMTSR